NNVVTSTMAFENGNVREYDGGYDDWLRQRPPPQTATATAKNSAANPAQPRRQPSGDQPRRLKYREQQELARLPELIESQEADIAAIHEVMADPDFYQQSGEAIAEKQSHLKLLERELARNYERWEELETLNS
ncbi:MAG: ABC transporter ATP-binding protein, partial [Pirellulaceae bacterium]